MNAILSGHILWLLVLLSILLAGCNDTLIEVVDPSLAGAWRSECRIGVPVVFDPTRLPADVKYTHTLVDFAIAIHEDATVELVAQGDCP